MPDVEQETNAPPLGSLSDGGQSIDVLQGDARGEQARSRTSAVYRKMQRVQREVGSRWRGLVYRRDCAGCVCVSGRRRRIF